MVIYLLTALVPIHGLMFLGMVRKHAQMRRMMLSYLEDVVLRGGKLPLNMKRDK